jgi:hypothetical protein
MYSIVDFYDVLITILDDLTRFSVIIFALHNFYFVCLLKSKVCILLKTVFFYKIGKNYYIYLQAI